MAAGVGGGDEDHTHVLSFSYEVVAWMMGCRLLALRGRWPLNVDHGGLGFVARQD